MRVSQVVSSVSRSNRGWPGLALDTGPMRRPPPLSPFPYRLALPPASLFAAKFQFLRRSFNSNTLLHSNLPKRHSILRLPYVDLLSQLPSSASYPCATTNHTPITHPIPPVLSPQRLLISFPHSIPLTPKSTPLPPPLCQTGITLLPTRGRRGASGFLVRVRREEVEGRG